MEKKSLFLAILLGAASLLLGTSVVADPVTGLVKGTGQAVQGVVKGTGQAAKGVVKGSATAVKGVVHGTGEFLHKATH